MTTADVNQSQLVIIDVQTKLCNVMQEAEMQAVIKNTGILLQAATVLAVPVIATEQYPQALGETSPEIAQYFGGIKPVEKNCIFCLCGT